MYGVDDGHFKFAPARTFALEMSVVIVFSTPARDRDENLHVMQHPSSIRSASSAIVYAIATTITSRIIAKRVHGDSVSIEADLEK